MTKDRKSRVLTHCLRQFEDNGEADIYISSSLQLLAPVPGFVCEPVIVLCEPSTASCVQLQVMALLARASRALWSGSMLLHCTNGSRVGCVCV